MTDFFSTGAAIIFIPASVGAGAFGTTSSNGLSLSLAGLDAFEIRSNWPIFANLANAASASGPRPIGSEFIVRTAAGFVGSIGSKGVDATGSEVLGTPCSEGVGATGAVNEATDSAVNEAPSGVGLYDPGAGAGATGGTGACAKVGGAGANEDDTGACAKVGGAGAPTNGDGTGADAYGGGTGAAANEDNGGPEANGSIVAPYDDPGAGF